MHSVPEYYLLTEKIGWRLTDLDFDAIDVGNITSDDRLKIRETALIESGIPHYTDLWTAIDGFSGEWELRQFNLIWSSEEFRHAESLRLLADRLGVEIGRDLDSVEKTEFVKIRNASCKTRCYETLGGMLMYTTIQEMVTHKFYLKWSKVTESAFLRQLLGHLAADEMRHHQWFANALQRYLPRAPDPAAYRKKVVESILSFHMPHNFYEVTFPYIDKRMAEYFSTEDWNWMKQKVIKILSFDEELFMMLLAVGEEGLTRGLGQGVPAKHAGD